MGAVATIPGLRSDDARRRYVDAYDRVVAASPVPLTELDLDTPYGHTRVLTAGDPGLPPLLGLHGKAISSTMWIPLLDTLTASHRVFLVDTIGDLNKSVATRVLHDGGDVARWLDAVLHGLSVTEAAVVGLSYGAWIGATYAMARPEAVERLAILSPAGVFSGVRPAWMARALYANLIRPRPETLRRFMATMYTRETAAQLEGSVFGQVIDQYIGGIMEFRSSTREARPRTYRAEALAALTMPVLVIIGDEETVCDGPRSAGIARQRLPHARVELVAHANHSVTADQPEIVEQMLRQFLAE
jgi:pimeloyl-ACP methyl ester carboxylesterase